MSVVYTAELVEPKAIKCGTVAPGTANEQAIYVPCGWCEARGPVIVGYLTGDPEGKASEKVLVISKPAERPGLMRRYYEAYACGECWARGAEALLRDVVEWAGLELASCVASEVGEEA